MLQVTSSSETDAAHPPSRKRKYDDVCAFVYVTMCVLKIAFYLPAVVMLCQKILLYTIQQSEKIKGTDVLGLRTGLVLGAR